MDTVLKQRLIGAIILVTLAVIFLPMLVKGPAPESGVESVSLDIPAPPPVADQPTQELPLVSSTGRDAPHPVENGAKASASAPPTAMPSALAHEERGGLKPTLAAGDFVVHFGVFAQAELAQSMARRLQQANLAATAERIPDRQQTAWRVRIGPFSDQAQAQAARIEAAARMPGHVAEVVVLDASAPAQSPHHPTASAKAAVAVGQTPARPNGAPTSTSAHAVSARGAGLATVGFVIQVGAYTLKADAEALRDRLRTAGFIAFVESVQTPKGPFHRVRVGPVADRVAADQMKAQIATKLGVDGLVKHYP